MQTYTQQIIHFLKRHYSAPLSVAFRQFRSGVIFFSVGIIIFYLANASLEPSLKQEIITLLSLIIAGAGFIVAIMAHIRMIISRIFQFLKKSEDR